MSTVNQEPTFGMPQSHEGSQMVGSVNPAVMAQPMGMPGMPNNMVQPMQQTPAQVTQQAPAQVQQMPGIPNTPNMQQMGVPGMPAQQSHPEVSGVPGSVGTMVPPQVNVPGMQYTAPVNPAVQMPGQIPDVNQFPTIQDGAPVAQMPNTVAQQAPVQQYQQPEMAQMAPAPGMQYGNMQPDPAAQAAQMAQIQQGYGQQMHQPAPAQSVGQQQMQQMQQYQHPQQSYNPMYGQQQPMQQMQQPGMTAPGAANGSYLPGGNLGHTPTGHPEKQKFTSQARLIFVKNRPTKKNTVITTGLLSTNMNDRNAPASNFVCFSGSAAKQIDIIENMQVRPQYTNIEKASGQVIQFEGSWEWNSKSKEPGWQLMMDNFFFVNDPQLRNKAESYVPPIPTSPMDMLMGGNMQGQQMYGQPQMQQGYQQPMMQGMAPAQPQGYGMPGQQMQQGMPQQQVPNYGYQMPGMPGMPGQH